jgi:3D (Asp-Asp-Asp) domain-containing protein
MQLMKTTFKTWCRLFVGVGAICLLLHGEARSGSPRGYRYITVKVTGYCPCSICTDGDGITATGTTAWRKGVAVDPLYIRQDARIDIPGYGNWVLADDVGGAIKKHHIDVRFVTHWEAKQWGTQWLRVRVWE